MPRAVQTHHPIDSPFIMILAMADEMKLNSADGTRVPRSR